MGTDRVRIGVIGVGFGAEVQIPAFQSEELDVVAVCASRDERARETSERFNVPHFFTDYNAMVQMEDLDAVSVVSPPALHHPMVMAALEAGKHVLCEKPFTTDQAKGLEMSQKAEATGLTAMIAHEFRFASGRMLVKELIDEGYVGPLHMVLINVLTGPQRGFQARPLTYRDDASQGNGYLFALGSHYIDCLRHWFGEITSVSGRVFTHFGDRLHPESGKVEQATSDDTFHFLLRLANRGWASMTGTNAASFGPGGRIEIYARNGTLVTPHVGLGLNPPSHGTVLGAKVGDEGITELSVCWVSAVLDSSGSERLG